MEYPSDGEVDFEREKVKAAESGRGLDAIFTLETFQGLTGETCNVIGDK